ncbi:hypothetical protein HaLaN_15578, partial [Haematococcus lacustris]
MTAGAEMAEANPTSIGVVRGLCVPTCVRKAMEGCPRPVAVHIVCTRNTADISDIEYEYNLGFGGSKPLVNNKRISMIQGGWFARLLARDADFNTSPVLRGQEVWAHNVTWDSQENALKYYICRKAQKLSCVLNRERARRTDLKKPQAKAQRPAALPTPTTRSTSAALLLPLTAAQTLAPGATLWRQHLQAVGQAQQQQQDKQQALVRSATPTMFPYPDSPSAPQCKRRRVSLGITPSPPQPPWQP